jgi:surface antigen
LATQANSAKLSKLSYILPIVIALVLATFAPHIAGAASDQDILTENVQAATIRSDSFALAAVRAYGIADDQSAHVTPLVFAGTALTGPGAIKTVTKPEPVVVATIAPRTVIAAQKTQKAKAKSSSKDAAVTVATGSTGHKQPNTKKLTQWGPSRFGFGYCTEGVASWRKVYWGGNAGEWLGNARAVGFETGMTPEVNAIMVTNESGWGHVALVTSVDWDNKTFTVREQNYAGWNIESNRTLPFNFSRIKGFIY